MFAKIYELIFTNWKTTVAGFVVTAVFWLLDEVLKLGLTEEQKIYISGLIVGLGAILPQPKKK